LVRREGREVAGRGGIRAAVPGRLAARWGRRKEGEGERLIGGAHVSPSAGKRKAEAVRWAAAGGFGGPAGLVGPKGEKVSFFSFLCFQTLFKTNFSFQIQTKFFQLFLKIL
jgi:hypothetical protein